MFGGKPLLGGAKNTEQPTIDEEPDNCRAALVDCLDQMARTPKSAVSPDFIAAIDDGRKALGES